MTGSDCRRTHGLIDRVVGGRVTSDDRAHAATCASCGPVLDRAVRFDDDLRRSARRLVVEDLPRGILEPGLGGQVDRPRFTTGLSSGFTTTIAAVAILVLATAVAIGPGQTRPSGSPGSTGSPTLSIGPSVGPSVGPSTGPSVGPSTGPPAKPLFNPTSSIVSSVVELGYACNDGRPIMTNAPSEGPAVRESAICTAPEDAGPYVAVIVVGESATNEVVTVWIKGNVVGSDTPSSRDAIAIALARLATIALHDTEAGRSAGDFVILQLRGLDPGDPELTTDVGGARVHLERPIDGGYRILVAPLPPA